MPLIQVKCTNCGATMEIDDRKDAAVCPNCESAFVVEKAINYFNTTNHITKNASVNTSDFIIRAGKLEKYNGASTTVIIPDSVIIIGPGAFAWCEGLTSVQIPNSVTRIEKCAFDGCKGLTGVQIPNSVTYIGENAFRNSGLTTITIPESVARIGYEAFSNCSALTEVTILGNTALEENESFEGEGSISYVFDRCLNLAVINASEDWKRTYYQHARCLSPYAPKPVYTNSNNGGCYIATSVYGSYDCPQVWTLRRYRDSQLSKTLFGRSFIRCYYLISPLLVQWLGNAPWFKKFWRKFLDNMVEHLNDRGVDNTPYTDT